MKTFLPALCLGVICSVYASDPAAPGGAQAPLTDEPVLIKSPAVAQVKFGADDVEVRMAEGSVIRGQLRELETISFVTPYGVLNFPVKDVLHLSRGRRLSAKEATTVQAAIKDLDAEGFARRNAAQQKLESLGSVIIDALREARGAAPLEARTRIEAVLSKLQQSDQPRVQTQDIIVSEKMEVQGTVKLEAIRLKSALGDLQIRFEDIISIRWLAKGTLKDLPLEVNDGLVGWVDTGVDLIKGQACVVRCSGEISFAGTLVGPAGNPSWQHSPFPSGCVIGRIGATGNPFQIGKQWSGVAEASDKLFVRIAWPPDNVRQNDSGAYKLQIMTGSMAESMKAEFTPR
ncbi:MAG TPA: hypothetical protein VEK08_12440 [Planctomycetota bacterium]|nr:hypothetical protein [Planctomycetota bacterium]